MSTATTGTEDAPTDVSDLEEVPDDVEAGRAPAADEVADLAVAVDEEELALAGGR